MNHFASATLESILSAYFQPARRPRHQHPGSTNVKEGARKKLLKAVSKRIQDFGDLTDDEKKRLEQTVFGFIRKENHGLSRQVIRYLDKRQWEKLRIEVRNIQ